MIIAAIFVNNIVLAQFLGICPFLGVSKKVDTAAGMGMAVAFVMLLATLVTWPVYYFVLVPYGLQFMQTIVYILVIAALVQMVEIILKKSMPSLYSALGVFLPLITTNCTILGVAINVINFEYTLLESAVYAVAAEVPSGGLPIATGALVQNVGTAFAVYEAVQKNKPLIERVVTVTGKSVAKPSNFLARIGVPIQQLIEAAGGVPEDTGKIISGGPMMGKAMPDTNSYMVKGCSGILVMKNEEARRKEAGPCIKCAKCVHACPMGLQPNFLAKFAEKDMLDKCEEERIYDCIECGSCSFSCPANRPLLDWIRQGKPKVMGILRARAAEAKAKADAAKAAAAAK